MKSQPAVSDVSGELSICRPPPQELIHLDPTLKGESSLLESLRQSGQVISERI